MSKREGWLFQYTAHHLRDAANVRAIYERDRAAWWDGEYKLAADKAKETGVEVREYDVTGGKNAQLVLDATLQARINECSQKRAQHQKAADEYEQWRSIFASQNAELTLQLDATDVLYFGLGK